MLSRIIGFVFLCFLLSSCTFESLPQQHFIAQSSSVRQHNLAGVNHWHATGVMSLRANKASQFINWSWQQDAQHYRLQLSGALNFGEVTVQGKPGQVTVLQNGKRLSAHTPEALLMRLTGWCVPVSSLYYWLRSIPVAKVKSHAKFDQFGHLIQLDQQGWAVNYERFHTIKSSTGVMIDLPSRIDIHNQRLKIRLVITKWQL